MIQPCLSGRGSATHARVSEPHTLVNAHAPLLVGTRYWSG